MAQVLREILYICRFCLCQNENQLSPIEEILPLSCKDVERFTGITINTREPISYAICFDCTQKLKISADFRQSCLNNNAQFQELLTVLNASAKSAPIEAVKSFTYQESDPLDLHFVVKDDDDDDEEVEEDIVEIYDEDGEYVDDSNSQQQRAWNVQEEDYSANYIEIGECSESDEYEPCYEQFGFSKKSRNKTLPCTTQPTKTNPMVEETQGRKIVTYRTSKSYLPKQLCNLCGKLVTNITVHLDSHANDRKYACPHCPVRMTNKGNLVKHIHAVHLKLISKTCKICGKGFTNNNSYLSHMVARHGIGDRYTCTLCSRIFNHKSSLYDHMRRAHSHVRNLACEICGKSFKVNRALKMHMSVHSTEQPYPCGKCPKRFKSSYARKIHELTHSGIVFECALCGKSYRYKSLLNIHMKKIHPQTVEQAEEDESAGNSMNSD